MTKLEWIENILMGDGQISNIETVYGAKGVRTTRLSESIRKLRARGWKISTNEVRGDKGQYIDCIYKLQSLPKEKQK